MAQLNFDARNVKPDAGFEPIPSGWYNVIAIESEIKVTNDGQGRYLRIVYRVLDGPCANRQVSTNFNIQNNNPKAQEIAFGQLSAMCHAVGVLMAADSQQLHGIPLKIKVALRDARTDKETGKTYEASNEVKGWKNINEPIESAAVPGAPAAGGVPAGFGAPAGFAGAPVQNQQWQAPPQGQQPVYAPQQPQGQQPAPQQPWGAPPQGAQPQGAQPQQPVQGQPQGPQGGAWGNPPPQGQQPAYGVPPAVGGTVQPQAPWTGGNPAAANTAMPPWSQPTG